MFLKWLNSTQENSYQKFYELGLGIMAGLLVFRKPATIAIFIFVLLNCLFYNKMRFHTKKWIPIIIISIPLLLDFIFLWNNEIVMEGVKNGEKHLSTFVFSLLIINQAFSINIQKVLRIYSIIFTSLLAFCFLFHFFEDFGQFQKYLNGIEVWQMGYKYALSMNVHAPALNMHVAFLVVVNFYLFLSYFLKNKNLKALLIRFSFFATSLFLLFVLNTRLAVVNTLFGIILITVLELSRKVPRKRFFNILGVTLAVLGLFVFSFVKTFPYLIEKYTNVTFAHMDKVGKLDEFKNPEAEVFSSLVTRISIWKTTCETIQDNLLTGVGAADSRKILIQAYIDSNQKFLAKYEFPVHNQYLDFSLKFGILGLFGVFLYIFHIIWLGWKSKHSLIIFFFVLFFTSNLTDDFLIRFDGITFSALWISIFANIYWNNLVDKSY